MRVIFLSKDDTNWYYYHCEWTGSFRNRGHVCAVYGVTIKHLIGDEVEVYKGIHSNLIGCIEDIRYGSRYGGSKNETEYKVCDTWIRSDQIKPSKRNKRNKRLKELGI